MFPKAPVEQILVVLFDNPDTIILAGKDKPLVVLIAENVDLCHGISAIFQGIVDQVIEDLLEQWICINFKIRPVNLHPYRPHGQGRTCLPDTFIDILPDEILLFITDETGQLVTPTNADTAPDGCPGLKTRMG